jgi:hypothetical protein
MESTRREFPTMLATEVPYWSEIERMSVRRAPIPAFARGSAAAQIYAALWTEVSGRMGSRLPASSAAPTAAH